MLRRPATKIFLTRADVDAYEERNPIINGEPITSQSERRHTNMIEPLSKSNTYGDGSAQQAQMGADRDASQPTAEAEQRNRIMGPDRIDRSVSGAVGPTSANIQR